MLCFSFLKFFGKTKKIFEKLLTKAFRCGIIAKQIKRSSASTIPPSEYWLIVKSFYDKGKNRIIGCYARNGSIRRFFVP
jgi:hypothetical protein